MVGRIHKHALERLNFQGDVPVATRLAACKTFLRSGRDQGIVRWAGRDWHIACVLQYLPDAPPQAPQPVLDYDFSDWQAHP